MALARKQMYGDNNISADSLGAAIAAVNAEIAYRDSNGQLLSVAKLSYSESNQGDITPTSGPLQSRRKFSSDNRYALISHDEGADGINAFFKFLSKLLPAQQAQSSFQATQNHLQATASERHSLLNIHQEMFFYCQRVLNSSFDKGATSDTDKQRMFNAIYDDVYRAINNDIAAWLNSGSFSTANFNLADRKQLVQFLHADEKKAESERELSPDLRKKLLKRLEGELSWTTRITKKMFGTQEKSLFISVDETQALENFLDRKEGNLSGKLKKHLSIDEINQHLNQCRGSYCLFARMRVASQLVVDGVALKSPKKAGIFTDVGAAFEEEIKHDLKLQVAIENFDQIESNRVLGLLTHTEGVNTTAHSKGKAEPAIAQVDQYAFGSDGVGEHLQTQFRCPSLQALRGWVDWLRGKNAPSKKVCKYIEGFVKQRALKAEDGPITYNLLTSINYSVVDMFDNNQARTARDIFLATHLYNKGAQENAMPLCFVMNLPVNQHTLNLGYDSWSDVGREAMLFSEWGIMIEAAKGWLNESCKVTGRDDVADNKSLNSWLKDQLSDMQVQYNAFLAKEAEGVFADSQEGKQARENLAGIKKQLGKQDLKQHDAKDDSNKTKLKSALMRLYSQNFDGKTTESQEVYCGVIQAMHIALTKNGLEGCKSANERYGLFIKNLANLFLAYSEGRLSIDANKGVNSAIDGLRHGRKMQARLSVDGQWVEDIIHRETDFSNVSAVSESVQVVNLSAEHWFTHRILKVNNQFNAYGSGAHAAQNDTGTPKAGVEPNPTTPYDIAVHHWNTTTFLPGQNDRVKQSCAKEAQAHKGLPKGMVKMYGLAKTVKDQLSGKNTVRHDEVYIEVCKRTLKDYLKLDKYKITRFITRHHRGVIDRQVKALSELGQESKNISSVLGMLDNLLAGMKSQKGYNKDGLATQKIQQLQTFGRGFFDSNTEASVSSDSPDESKPHDTSFGVS